MFRPKGLLGAALAASCALAFSAPAAAQFETRGQFTVGDHPTSIAAGDFDGDGIVDIAVVAGDSTNGVVVLLGNGDGTFRFGSSFSAGVGAVSVVSVDFDHDGNLDLAVANSLSSYISIFLGNGDGTFRPGPQNPPVPQPLNFVGAGDFNGDGIPDLVGFSFAWPHNLSVFFGKGDGTFQNPVITDTEFSIESIGVGDFNGDGNLDVVTAGDFTINVLLGQGNGRFERGASYPSDDSPASIAVAGFSNNQKLDLAIANSSGIAVMMGNGDGTFQRAIEYPTDYPLSVAVADFNGDHIPDLAAANSFVSSGATVFPGNGDGTFQSGMFYPGGEESDYVAVGDFNGDGQTDMVLAEKRFDRIFVLLNTGVATFSPTTPLNFKNQAVGKTSPPQTITVTNTGAAELKIQSMRASAEFGVTSTCGSGLAPGASCTISATFLPTQTGAVQGTITIIDSASTKPQVIELSGTGT